MAAIVHTFKGSTVSFLCNKYAVSVAYEGFSVSLEVCFEGKNFLVYVMRQKTWTLHTYHLYVSQLA